jgi:hypothetical protein
MAVNKYVDLNTVKRIRPHFLYSPLLVEGVVNLVAGEGGVGKSTLVLDWVAKASRGLLEGDYKGRPCRILIYSQEDSASLLKSRLEAAGADLDRIIPIYKQDDESMEGVADPYTLPADKGLLEQALTDNSASVLVLDPITSLIAGDSNKRDDVRKSLDPLAALASRLDVTVIGLLHFNKGGGYASDKISGSHAFRDLCRSLILVAKDDGTQERAASIDKSNYSQAVGTSYSFTIADKDLPDDSGETEHIGVVSGWRKSDTSVAQIINRNHAVSEPESNDCERDVIDYLTEQGGSAPKAEVVKALTPDYTRKQIEHARDRNPLIVSSRSGYPAKALWSYVGKLGNPGKPSVSNGSQLPMFGETEADYPTVGKLSEPRNTNDPSPSDDGLPSLPSITEWARGILGSPAPSDEEYQCMSDEQVDALANAQGLYASKAWAERERRREMESSGVSVNA